MIITLHFNHLLIIIQPIVFFIFIKKEYIFPIKAFLYFIIFFLCNAILSFTMPMLSTLLLFIFLLFSCLKRNVSLQEAVITSSILYLSIIFITFFSRFLLFHYIGINSYYDQMNSYFSFSLFLLLLLSHLTNRFIYSINKNKLRGFFIGTIPFSILTFYQMTLYFLTHQSDIYRTLAIIVVLIALIIGFLFMVKLYEEASKKKVALTKQRIEHETIFHYLNTIEKQYDEIKRFKHDYLNILLSLEGFIEKQSLQELSDYYYTHLKETKTYLNTSDFKLGNLSKIKDNSLKILLAKKLIFAQEQGIDIHLEVTALFHPTSLDSIVPIRILGITLDNAIEELLFLQKGQLNVVIFIDSRSTLFIIENTCRTDILPLYKLEEKGFSTKGRNRGLGLPILSNLSSMEENVICKTIIDKNKFVQKITFFHSGGE